MMREEGWKELNEKHGTELKYVVKAREYHKDKYNSHYSAMQNTLFWDTKQNDLYYSQPASVRAWISLKKVSLTSDD